MVSTGYCNQWKNITFVISSKEKKFHLQKSMASTTKNYFKLESDEENSAVFFTEHVCVF